MSTDGSGHVFREVENLRVTYIPARDRSAAKDWAGSDVIRIQAYKDGEGVSKALHTGAEFPVGSREDLAKLANALHDVYDDGQRRSIA